MSIFTIFSVAFFAIGIALSYWLFLRPILRERPELKTIYEQTDSIWLAIRLKFVDIKTKIVAALVMIASGLLSLYEFLLPVATGIDWTPIRQRLPDEAWPIIFFAMGAIFFWLRKVTERTAERRLEAVRDGETVDRVQFTAGLSPEPPPQLAPEIATPSDGGE